jgi:hypothetical protein
LPVTADANSVPSGIGCDSLTILLASERATKRRTTRRGQ